MTVAFVQKTTTAFGSSVTSFSAQLTGVTAGNALAMTVTLVGSGSTIAAVPTPTGSWSVGEAPASGDGSSYFPKGAIFYKQNVASGTHTANWSSLDTDSYIDVDIVEFSGASTTAALGVHGNTGASTTGASGATVTSPTTAVADAVVIFNIAPDCQSLGAPPSSGYTSIGNDPGGGSHMTYSPAYKILTATGAPSATWTWSTAGGYTGHYVGMSIVLQAASGSNQSVTPGAATVTLSGLTPTMARTANQSVGPAQAAIALAGQVPTIARTSGTIVSPAQASVSLAGQSPSITRSANQAVSPAAAAVSFAGPAPTMARTANQGVSPGNAAVALQGLAPSIAQQLNTGVNPGSGALAVQGFAPTVAATANQGVAPGAGVLAFAGLSPTIANSSAPPAPTGLPGLDYEAAPGQRPRRAKFVSIKPPLQAALERRFPDAEQGEPTYSQMRVDEASSALIRAWAAAQGFQTVADDLHVTLAYSREPVDLSGVQLLDGFAVPRAGRALDQFGDAVVLTLTSATLTEQWQAMRDAGASWDFPEYQPHITITYEKGDIELADVRPYIGPIVLLDEERSALETGFDAEEAPIDAALTAGLVELQNEQLTPELVTSLAQQWRPAAEIEPNTSPLDAALQYLLTKLSEKRAQEAQAAQLEEQRRSAKAKADDEEAIAHALTLLF